MKDYSQGGEQEHIIAALHKPGEKWEPARFLDIGAWHATEFSNTRALFELGWSGVMVEPSPGPMLGLVKEYGYESRITLIQAAVVCEAGLIQLHVSDDAISTTVEAEREKWEPISPFHGSLFVPGITLQQIANQFAGFEFVNIDAEGVSVDLFKQAIDLGWRPRCWCVEIDRRQDELAAIAESAGYKSVNDLRFGTLGNGCNAVLVRQ